MPGTIAPAPAAPAAPAARAAQPASAKRPTGQGRFTTVARVAHDVLGWLLAASATVLSASGQVEYAIDANITDLRRFLVPAILEIAAIFLILGGYLRACDGDSPATLWLLAAAVTGFATWTNLSHSGPRAGRIFAAATIVTFVLWLLKLRDRYRAARRASGLIDAPTAKFRLIRWLVMPRQTSRAWLIAVEYGLRDADLALERARLWLDTARTVEAAATGTGTPQTRRRAAHRAADLAVRQTFLATTTRAQPSVGVAPNNTTATVPDTAGEPSPADPQPGHEQQQPAPLPGARPPVAPTGTDHTADGPAQPARDPVADADAAPPSSAPTDGTLPGPPEPPIVGPSAAVPEQQPAAHVPAGVSPAPSAGTPTSDSAGPYQPVSEEDAVMYRTWRQGIEAGREPTGADLARATGRPDDTSAIGRRAARRYRDAHAAARRAGNSTGHPASHNGHRLSSATAGQ